MSTDRKGGCVTLGMLAGTLSSCCGRLLDIFTHPRSASLLKKGPDSLLPLRAYPQPCDGRRRCLTRLDRMQLSDIQRHELRGAHSRRAVLCDLTQHPSHRLVELL